MSDTYSEPELKVKDNQVTEKEATPHHLSEVEHFSDGSFSAEDLETIAAHIDDYDLAEAKRIVNRAINEHFGDPCLKQSYYNHLLDIIKGPVGDMTEPEWEAALKLDAFLINDWSIYPEVRSVTRPIDEPEYENYENIRVYLISIVWSCAGSVLATFFAVRFPSISLSSVAVQILIAYTGKAFAYIPDFSFPIGFKRRIHFGGGKWNFKEQMLAATSMTTGNVAPYSQSVILAMANDHFYGFKHAKGNFGFIVMLTLATNLMGFGLAGIFRVFLIYPPRLLWYICLPSLRLSRILVESEVGRENVNGWRLKGWEFFWIFSLVEFLWYWVTDFLFMFLATFDWVAWIAHTNNNMLVICGVNGGLGINPIPSLDWSIFTPSAMVTPFFATFSNILGMGLSVWVIIGMFYNNLSWTGYLPVNTNTLYANNGEPYDVSQVLDENHNLSKEKYLNYSMPFWSAGNLVNYGSFFAFYPAMLVYAILNYGDVLIYSFKMFWTTIRHPGNTLANFDDRFSRAQRKYKEVPEWWYILFLLICLGLGIATVEHYKFTNTPVWTIFFGIGLAAVFMVPCGVLFATTNTQVVINVLYELIIGLTNEGNGSALMVAKAFATNFMVETDSFVNNLKSGHYAGIAPRSLFRLQIANCVVNSFVQSGLMVWQSTDGAIKDLCSLKNRERFYCQGIRTYFNAAVQWGTIGPRRVLRDLYPGMRYTFLLGALLPIPFWALRRFLLPFARKQKWGEVNPAASRFRNSFIVRYIVGFEWLRSINEVIILSGSLNWAPTNFMYVWPGLYVGLIFQVYIRTYYPRWWQKYNYLLYAAITVGYSYSALIMFFATQYNHIAQVDWWGNDTGVSLSSEPRLVPEEGQIFGPKSWKA